MDGILKDIGLAWAKGQPPAIGAALAALIVAVWLAYRAWTEAEEPKWQSPWFIVIVTIIVGGSVLANNAYDSAVERCRTQWRTNDVRYLFDRCDSAVHCDRGILPSPCGSRRS
jgi:hypothetical protein